MRESKLIRDLPLTTTLTDIRAARPCGAGWVELLGHLCKTRADDEPLPLNVILDSNGLDDTLWVLDKTMGLRVVDEVETRGIDTAVHAETGYDLSHIGYSTYGVRQTLIVPAREEIDA